MKISRRSFVKAGVIAGSGVLTKQLTPSNVFGKSSSNSSLPFVISTWDFGKIANTKTMELLQNNTDILDAITAGVNLVENDPNITSVGYGGLPDEDGIVTLDASIMDWKGNAGSVAAIEGIKNPISVAKLVMRRTKHVMLAGEGAKKFALENGFKEENLLTENSKKAWIEWKRKFPHGENRVDSKNHDTIGMLAIDKSNNISGGVSTSGMAYKIHGRVGDSPIIGAAMFVDNDAGGATATGNGEFVMKTLGSFLIVEKMREGLSPQKACEFAIQRIYKIAKNDKNIQIGYLALNKNGEYGAYSLYSGFNYSVANSEKNVVVDSDYLIK